MYLEYFNRDKDYNVPMKFTCHAQISLAVPTLKISCRVYSLTVKTYRRSNSTSMNDLLVPGVTLFEADFI